MPNASATQQRSSNVTAIVTHASEGTSMERPSNWATAVRDGVRVRLHDPIGVVQAVTPRAPHGFPGVPRGARAGRQRLSDQQPNEIADEGVREGSSLPSVTASTKRSS